MIPVCEPTIGEEELRNVIDCIKTNWISSKGRYIEEFERKFSRYCGVRHGVTTTNGTTALHLAVSSLGIGKGDEVIIPTFTMIATAFAVTYTGAKPVFVDSELGTWNINAEEIEERITKKTKAIMPVHIYGHPCDMDAIRDIADDHNLYVVEDAAEAHGAEYKGKKVGGLSDIGCFSFYANKIITTGEGGIIVTDDDKIAEQAGELRDLAHSKKTRFLHEKIGYNYRMTNIQAAIGVAQLEKIEKFVDARRSNANVYNSLLRDIDGITLPLEKSWAKNVYWMYAILVDGKKIGMNRDRLMEELGEQGIDTRTFFVPIHKQPVYSGTTKEKFPISEHLAENGLYLPSSSKLTVEEIREVCDAISSLTR